MITWSHYLIIAIFSLAALFVLGIVEAFFRSRYDNWIWRKIIKRAVKENEALGICSDMKEVFTEDEFPEGFQKSHRCGEDAHSFPEVFHGRHHCSEGAIDCREEDKK